MNETGYTDAMEVDKSIRELVAVIYRSCFGAYGGDYKGDFEYDIQNVADAITREIRKTIASEVDFAKRMYK